MKMLAAAIKGALDPAARARATIIPIPPSKVRSDPSYDARMTIIAKTVALDARDLIELIEPRSALHDSDKRLKPDEMYAALTINPALCQPFPTDIILLDDVITTGCTFVACHQLLRQQFPNVPISGIFAARRVPNRSSDFGIVGMHPVPSSGQK